MDTAPEDLAFLIRDKYDGDAEEVTPEDRQRLASGEPLAYVIGWVPFLGLRISLESRPLIPRPETEWWTELLVERLKERFADAPFAFLDLCAGPGAIGLSVLNAFPNAQVSFGELIPEHCEQIRKNIELNGLDASRADIRSSDLFAAFEGSRFDVIATNPPYIPNVRELDNGVVQFEPSEALFSGADGLDVIRKIAESIPGHLAPSGEAWMECDIENIGQAQELLEKAGAERSAILTDLYGRQRVVVSYFP